MKKMFINFLFSLTFLLAADSLRYKTIIGDPDISFPDQQHGSGFDTEHSMFFADIDLDGKDDVITWNSSYGERRLVYKTSSGSMPSISDISYYNSDDNFSSTIFVYDIDNDNDLDVIESNSVNYPSNFEINVYKNDGNNPPNFTKQTLHTHVRPDDWGGRMIISSISVADLNNDNLADIVFSTGTPSEFNEFEQTVYKGSLHWLENTVSGDFTHHAIDTSASISSLHIADVNADELPDILITTKNNPHIETIYQDDFEIEYQVKSSILLYENNNLSFNKIVINDNLNGAYSLTTGDIDGDGDLDIISGTEEFELDAFYDHHNYNFRKYFKIIFFENNLGFSANSSFNTLSETEKLNNGADYGQYVLKSIFYKDVDNDNDYDIIASFSQFSDRAIEGWDDAMGRFVSTDAIRMLSNTYYFLNNGQSSFKKYRILSNDFIEALTGPMGILPWNFGTENMFLDECYVVDFLEDDKLEIIARFYNEDGGSIHVYSLDDNNFDVPNASIELDNSYGLWNDLLRGPYDYDSRVLNINYYDNDIDGDIMIPSLSLSYYADNGSESQSFSLQNIVLDRDSSYLKFYNDVEYRQISYQLNPEIFKEHLINAFDILGVNTYMNLYYNAVFELSDGSASQVMEYEFMLTSESSVSNCYDPKSIFINTNYFPDSYQFEEDVFQDNDGVGFHYISFPDNYFYNGYMDLDSIVVLADDSTLGAQYLGYNGADQAIQLTWNENWYGTAEVMVITYNSPNDLMWWIEGCSWVPDVDWNDFSGIIDTNYFSITALPKNDDPHINLMAYASENIFNEVIIEPFVGAGGDSVFSIDEDNSLGILYNATDVDDSTLVMGFNVIDGEFEVEFNNDSILTISPTINWNGLGKLALTATDTSGAIFSKMVYVEVNPINDSPTISSITDTTVNEDQVLLLSIDKNDVESEFLIIEISMSENIQPFLFANGDSVMFVPNQNWNGTEQFTISVFDTDGASDETTFEIFVMPIDDEPEINILISDVYFYEDFLEPWHLDLSSVFVDIDGELNYSVDIIDSSVITTEIIGNDLNLYPILNSYGVTDIIVKASNPTRASVVDTFTVTIFNVNDGPFIGNLESFEYLEGNTIILPSIFTMDTSGVINDLDNTITELNFNLSIDDLVPASIIWDNDLHTQPVISFIDSNYYGNFSVSVCVSDEQFEECGDIDIIVAPVNDAPFFVGGVEKTIGLNIPFNIEIDIMDIDSDTLMLSLLSSFDYPEWFNLSGSNVSGISDSLDSFIFPLELSDGTVSIVDSIKLHVENFVPKILDIRDIPNDQGGRVYIAFKSSYFDNGNNNINYGVYREDTYLDTMAWIGLNSLNGTGEDNYVYEVQTLYDSTINSAGITNFKVVAYTENGIYHSQSHSGYSLDNIAPMVPTGMLAASIGNYISLEWDISPDEDFQYYELVRSGTDGDDLVIELVETSYEDFNIDAGIEYSYKIAAYDYNGNFSGYSEPVLVSMLSSQDNGLVPVAYALQQNFPNPFNPTTQINYELPNNDFVSIDIYDVMGQRVKSLISSNQVAGFRSVQWNATNDLGQPVSAGMYIYTIQAGEFRQTRKMVLLK